MLFTASLVLWFGGPVRPAFGLSPGTAAAATAVSDLGAAAKSLDELNDATKLLVAYINRTGQRCDPVKVNQLIVKGANPEAILPFPSGGVSILGYAASVNAKACVADFIRRGVRVGLDSNSERDVQGALLAAIADTNHCDSGIVRDLLAAGSNVNDQFYIFGKTDLGPGTPLYSAVVSAADDSAAALKCAQILLSAGADPNFPAVKGKTPLMMAAVTPSTPHEAGFPQMVKLLLAKGAQPDVEDTDGKTALFFSLNYLGVGYGRCLQCAAMLLHAGADVDHVDNGGDTPLLYVMRNQPTIEAVKLLVGYKANVNAHNSQTLTTPLMLAAKYGNVDFVRFLLNAGALCFAKDAQGKTAGEYVTNNDKDLLRLLDCH